MYKTSSAAPIKLFRYSDITTGIDHDLISESWRLAGVLQRFEATCTEYRVPVADLADQLRNHVRGAEDTDVWVRQVGMAFKLADEQALLFAQIGQIAAKYGGIIAGSVSNNRQMLAEWADRTWGWLQAIEKVVGVVAIVPFIKVGPSGIPIIRVADWVTQFGLGKRDVREWINLGKFLTRITPEALPGHMLQVGKKAFWVDVAIKVAFDWVKYGLTTKFVSAGIVDTGISGASLAAMLAGAKLGVLAGAKLGAMLGTIVCPGLGTAFGIGLGILFAVATELLLDKYVRDKAVDLLSSVSGWTAQQVKAITTSIVMSIAQRVPGAAQVVRNITQSTVQAISGVSVAAQAVRNVTQNMVQAVTTGVLETAIDVNLSTLVTMQAVFRGMAQGALMVGNVTQAVGQAIFSPFVLGPALQPL